MINKIAKNSDILATGLNVLHNYFDSSIKLSSKIFRYFNKTVLCAETIAKTWKLTNISMWTF